MLKKLALTACLLLPASCANLPIQVADTARLHPGELGFAINADVGAVNFAQWAFASPSRIRNRPADAARAAGAMDYIAGSLNTNPRWANISILTREQLLQGRAEVRQALGIAPGTPSQAVVDCLSDVADALQRNDQPAALRTLATPYAIATTATAPNATPLNATPLNATPLNATAPIFTAPPAAVLTRLSAMPYLQMANVSTMHAANELFGPNDTDWH